MGSKKLFRQVKAASLKYRMIENGDRVGVGVSGGKDSLILIHALRLLQEFTPLLFDIIPITVDCGWNQQWDGVTNYCSGLGLPHHVISTSIGSVVFEDRKESNPCSLCALLRSGTLNREARNLGCNKIALAHHMNDALTTLMLSMMFEGQFRTFKPVTNLDKAGLKLIRPLIYVDEKSIASLASALKLPVISNPCPASGHTNREKVSSFLSSLENSYPGSHRRMLNALENVDRSSFWDTEHLF